MADTRLTFTLPEPYNLRTTLRLLVMGSGDPSSSVTENSAAFLYQTSAGTVRIAAIIEDGSLQAEVKGDMEVSASKVERLFGLHDRPEEFQPDGPAGRILARMQGTHLPITPFLFSKLVQIVLQQLVSWDDASAAWRAIVRKYGEQDPFSSDLIACPTGERLKSLGYYDLVACGALPKQARLILQLAREADRIERLHESDPSKLLKWLSTIPGIGEWTIGYVRGFALGDPDVVIRGDYAIPDYVSWNLKRQPRSNDTEMEQWLQPFVGHRFRLVHLLMQGGQKPPRRGPKAASNRWRNRR